MDTAFHQHAAPLFGVFLWMILQVIDFTQDTKREKPFDLSYEERKFTLVL
jgi:hypothetical protein